MVFMHPQYQTVFVDPTFSCCLVGGDPHIHTFDDAWIHYQGSCNYLLAESSDPQNKDFKITTKFGPRNGNNLVTWLKSTEIAIGDITVGIKRRNITVRSKGHLLSVVIQLRSVHQ